MMATYNIFRLVFLFLRETVREPGWLFWSIFFPLILVAILFLQTDGTLDERLPYTLLSFIAVVTAIRGVGAYMLGRREAGFLKAFVAFPAAQKRYATAQLCAGVVFTWLVCFFFSWVLFFVAPHFGFGDMVVGWLRLFPLIVVMGCASAVLNLVPLKFQTVFGAVSITFAPLLLLTLAAQSAVAAFPIVDAVNTVNPVALGASFLEGGAGSIVVEQVVFAVISVVAFALTLQRFSTETYWDKAK